MTWIELYLPESFLLPTTYAVGVPFPYYILSFQTVDDIYRSWHPHCPANQITWFIRIQLVLPDMLIDAIVKLLDK